MSTQWKNDSPIYRQLYDRVVQLILEGVYVEGEAVPSVRTVSAEYQINHLTVAKAYQLLVDENLLEKRRGLGMYVKVGAQKVLLNTKKQEFLNSQLPNMIKKSHRLGINTDQLIKRIKQLSSEGKK